MLVLTERVMLQCIDPVLIGVHIGELSIFAQVGAAFLVQSVGWRKDFAHATAHFDPRDLSYLMHKMKGSCQTVAAMGIAAAFEQAEQDLPNLSPKDWALRSATLDAVLLQLEDEIKSILAGTAVLALPTP